MEQKLLKKHTAWKKPGPSGWAGASECFSSHRVKCLKKSVILAFVQHKLDMKRKKAKIKSFKAKTKQNTGDCFWLPKAFSSVKSNGSQLGNQLNFSGFFNAIFYDLKKTLLNAGGFNPEQIYGPLNKSDFKPGHEKLLKDLRLNNGERNLDPDGRMRSQKTPGLKIDVQTKKAGLKLKSKHPSKSDYGFKMVNKATKWPKTGSKLKLLNRGLKLLKSKVLNLDINTNLKPSFDLAKTIHATEKTIPIKSGFKKGLSACHEPHLVPKKLPVAQPIEPKLCPPGFKTLSIRLGLTKEKSSDLINNVTEKKIDDETCVGSLPM